MKTSRTFKVLFRQVKAKRKDDQAPIYVRITVDGKRTEFSLGKFHPIDEWDNKMSRAIGRTYRARAINDELDNIYADITTAYKELRKEGKFVTAQTVKARYLGLDYHDATLLDLFAYHGERMTGVLKPGTLKNYRTTKKYLMKFLLVKMKSSDIYLRHLNYGFLVDFEQYLRNKRNNLSNQILNNNGIMKHIERLKKLMNLAVKLEWLEKNPFNKYDLKYHKFDRPFLSIKELRLLEETVLKRDIHQRTRDVFVFGCYTGLSYIDMKRLTKDNIVFGADGKKWLSFYRKKSLEPVKIPLLNRALEILKKYDANNGSNLLLPIYSNQKMNQYIKVDKPGKVTHLRRMKVTSVNELLRFDLSVG
ncbi:site-specific integrase [Flagellimonas lutaonensis]|uniref:Integrase n=1 Tax=Flagellimonas lutaonensis TaxID=516051 RepID=A0A0D5YPU9_9FLAO|nr:site-specific integrase [Allomuricauda lutaonensis]AKA33903.1 integrase [Allomuricauda lutaonensis]